MKEFVFSRCKHCKEVVSNLKCDKKGKKKCPHCGKEIVLKS